MPPPTITAISPNAGPLAGGNVITITGIFLTGVSAVSFGGTPATSYTVVNSATITATVPAGTAGVIYVQVTTGGGTSSKSVNSQYTYANVPTVTGITPSLGTTAGGAVVTIYGTNFLSSATVLFGGTSSYVYKVLSSTEISAQSPPSSPGTVDVTVTTYATSATSSADQFTYTNTVPQVTGLSPSTGPRQGGTVVTVTGSGFTGATGVEFDGIAAVNFTVNSDTSITVTSPSATKLTSVHVAVTTLIGVSQTSSTSIFTYAVFGLAATAADQQWTCYFSDLLTNAILADLPVSGVTFGSTLNDTGSFGGTVNLADTRVQANQATSILLPGRTSIWVDLNGELVWGGILWTTAYDEATFALTLGGQDFWSYFANSRRLTYTIDPTNPSSGQTYSTSQPIDQLTLANHIIANAQSVSGGDIGTQLTPATSGQLISTMSIQGNQYLPLGQVFTQLSQQSGYAGFDYMVDVSWAGATPTNSLTLSYPRRGTVAPGVSVVIDVGSKSCLGYKWPKDASTQANIVYGVGSGTTAIAEDQASLTAGYPLLEDSYSRTDIADTATLSSVTSSYLAAKQNPIELPTVKLLTNGDTPFGTYSVGDDIRLIVPPDEYVPMGYDGYLRINAWTVNVLDQGTAFVELTLADPPSFSGVN